MIISKVFIASFFTHSILIDTLCFSLAKSQAAITSLACSDPKHSECKALVTQLCQHNKLLLVHCWHQGCHWLGTVTCISESGHQQSGSAYSAHGILNPLFCMSCIFFSIFCIFSTYIMLHIVHICLYILYIYYFTFFPAYCFLY